MEDSKNLVRLDPKRRRILVSGDFDYELGIDLLDYFLELDETAGDVDIVILASNGGDWTVTEGLIDIICGSKNMINTYCVGTNCSSAAMLFLAGDTRTISPKGKLMLHNISIGLDESYEKLINLTEIVKKELEQFHQYISERSNKPPKFFSETLSKGDFYISPQMALELELAHFIGVPNR